MLSDYSEALRRAIELGNNASVVALIEPRVKEGTATESEALLCGVLLMMGPFEAYEDAASIFNDLLNGRRSFEAAVWDAYRFAVLLPDGDRSFAAVLRSARSSAVAAHMLSLVADISNDAELALIENRRSRELRLFPFNIAEALKREPSLQSNARTDLWRTACDLIISRSAESDAAVRSVDGLLQRHWDNLILGTRLTSPVWTYYAERFGEF